MVADAEQGGQKEPMIANDRAVPEASEPPARKVCAPAQPEGLEPGVSRRRLETGLCWFLAIVLVWAGLSKLVDPVSFYGAVLEYRLPFFPILLRTTAVILPWMELFCGLLLVVGIARQATLLWVTALFTVFLVMVGQAFLRGLDISCGCFDLGLFGVREGSRLGDLLNSTGFATLRNMLLLAMVAVLWKSGAADRSAQPQPAGQ